MSLIASPSAFRSIGILVVVFGSLCEVAADVLFKQWAMGGRLAFFVVGLVVYFIGSLFWAYSLRFESISRAIIVFFIVNAVAVVLIGIFFYGEQMSLVNKLGILLGVLSLMLIEL